MTAFIAIVFMVISIAVAGLGFAYIHSDIQLIIALMGLLFSGAFSVLFLMAGFLSDIRNDVRYLADREEKAAEVAAKARAAARE